jgi:hypothetical protein
MDDEQLMRSLADVLRPQARSAKSRTGDMCARAVLRALSHRIGYGPAWTITFPLRVAPVVLDRPG